MSAQRRSRVPARTAISPLVGLALLVFCSQFLSAAAEKDENPQRPGVVARYQSADGRERVRVEDQLAHDWSLSDRWIARGPFSARFEGRLWIQTPGRYHLHVFAAGSVRLSLRGELLLDAYSLKALRA